MCKLLVIGGERGNEFGRIEHRAGILYRSGLVILDDEFAAAVVTREIDAAQATVAVGILECRVLEVESRIDKADGDALAGVNIFKAGNGAVNQAHASLHK